MKGGNNKMNKKEKELKIKEYQTSSEAILAFGYLLGMSFLIGSFFVFFEAWKVASLILFAEGGGLWFLLQVDLKKIKEEK